MIKISRVLFLSFLVLMFFSGCFEPETGVIKGQAFLKTRGGDVRTCAGEDVFIGLNGNQWIKDMISARLVYEMHKDKRENTSEDLEKISKLISQIKEKNIQKTTCDANGNFSFNMPYGTYRVITVVSWDVLGRMQGGVVSDMIEVKDKEQSIILN